MNKSVFIRLSGWALMLGTVMCYSFFPLSYLNNNGYNVARVKPGGESHMILTQREKERKTC